MWTVYVVVSQKNNWLYIGLTRCLDRRIAEHNNGYNKSTKGKGPFVLLHQETFPSGQEARQREKDLKSGCGREWLRSTFCK